MMNRIFAAGAVLLAFTALGCDKSADQAVIAKVNNARITTADFKRQLEGLENAQMQMAVVTDVKARKDFLEDLIGIELVIQEAKRQGMDKDPEFKKRQTALRKEMEQQLLATLRNDLFRGVLKKELTDKLGKVAPPTDKEAREFYAKNIDKMITLGGKRLSFAEVESRIKEVLVQNKQRDVYLDYTKDLKAKAKISIDEKKLDAAVAPATQPTGSLPLALPPGTATKDGSPAN